MARLTAPREIRFWDRMAKRYDAAPRSQLLQGAIDDTIALLGPDDVVLDVGCGSGPVSIALRPHVRAVHGIDISPGMIELAKRHEGDGLTFEVASFDDVDQRGVTAIVAFNVLHFLDLDAALQRFHQLLPDGGRVFVLAACPDDIRPIPRALSVAVGRLMGMPKMARFSAHGLAARFEAAGFAVETLQRRGGWAQEHWLVARRTAGSV